MKQLLTLLSLLCILSCSNASTNEPLVVVPARPAVGSSFTLATDQNKPTTVYTVKKIAPLVDSTYHDVRVLGGNPSYDWYVAYLDNGDVALISSAANHWVKLPVSTMQVQEQSYTVTTNSSLHNDYDELITAKKTTDFVLNGKSYANVLCQIRSIRHQYLNSVLQTVDTSNSEIQWSPEIGFLNRRLWANGTIDSLIAFEVK